MISSLRKSMLSSTAGRKRERFPYVARLFHSGMLVITSPPLALTWLVRAKIIYKVGVWNSKVSYKIQRIQGEVNIRDR